MVESEKHRILIVDDNHAIHNDFRKILASEERSNNLDELEADLFGTPAPTLKSRRQSFMVESAFQGEDGYEMVKRSVADNQHYALAFVDMRMPPGWDGLKTMEMIWSADPDIQIVICTAYSDYSWEKLFAQFGGGDRLLILKKPFDTAEVCQLACALTEKWHLARRAHLKLSQLRSMVEEQTRDLETANRKLLAEVEQRKRSEERYSLAALGANDGLWDWDLVSNEIYYSPRWKAILGHLDKEIGDSLAEWMDRVHPEDLPLLRADLDAQATSQLDHLSREFRMRHKDGNYRWVLCRGIAVHDGDGKVIRAAGSLTNITDRKMAEEQLRFEVLHDALTGLANRVLLTDRLEHCLARAKLDPELRFAVMFIDLDHFKVINDSLGHMVGDQLLVQIGQRLSACARRIDTIARVPNDHVARFGGDEFVMLLEHLADPVDAMRVAERVHAAISEPFTVDGRELRTFASIGIATGETRYARPEEMLRDADTALYQAKESGKACTRMFDPAMHERAVARWTTETDLHQAIERNELLLFYQPIMAADGQLASMEALVRWRHPTRGMVSPADFIAVAEETGLIVPMGRLILRSACAQLVRWRAAFPSLPSLAVGVNVSHKQFSDSALVDDVTEILRTTGLPAQCLRLEISETTAMRDAGASINMVSRLREMGVLIYMDDFGTGYSSLSQLHRMPIDALKIDCEFVGNMARDQVSRSIVEAITALAHAMGLRVIAEGVEDRDRFDDLRKIGCDFVQGYFFGKPMADEAATQFIARHAAERSAPAAAQ